MLYYIVDDEKMDPVEFGEFMKELFIREIARGVARLARTWREISDEDYPAFEQAVSPMSSSLNSMRKNEFSAEFEFGGSEGIDSTYAIEGGTPCFITTTTEEGGVETCGTAPH